MTCVFVSFYTYLCMYACVLVRRYASYGYIPCSHGGRWPHWTRRSWDQGGREGLRHALHGKGSSTSTDTAFRIFPGGSASTSGYKGTSERSLLEKFFWEVHDDGITCFLRPMSASAGPDADRHEDWNPGDPG